MKRLVFLLLLSISFLSPVHIENTDLFLLLEDELNTTDEIVTVTVPTLNDFLDDIGFRESSGRYNVVNRYGYMGKYQFNLSIVKRLGYDVTREEFLQNQLLQQEVMISLLRHNKQVLSREIVKHDSTYRNGKLITESGILASAHLIGPRRTRLYLDKNIISSDGNGTPLTEYLYSFSGYNLNL
jgi:hypothetical protein